jgi:hypothetical protein
MTPFNARRSPQSMLVALQIQKVIRVIQRLPDGAVPGKPP